MPRCEALAELLSEKDAELDAGEGPNGETGHTTRAPGVPNCEGDQRRGSERQDDGRQRAAVAVPRREMRDRMRGTRQVVTNGVARQRARSSNSSDRGDPPHTVTVARPHR